jgi:hypothetical protein
MQKIKELVAICKCSVQVLINPHKDYYETIEEYIDSEEKKSIPDEVFSEMVKRDTIVLVSAYADNPIGCFSIYHYDIDTALDLVLKSVKSES